MVSNRTVPFDTNASYTYDSQGQLLTETLGGTTYTYTYDTYGNIRSKSVGTTTVNYTYGSSDWLDLLTEYNGNSIDYDAIGNPTTWYDGTNFTWVNGRRLASAANTENGLNVSYTYDNTGLRLSKTVNGVEHKYIWNNGKLVSEYYNGTELEFFYDESGCPAAFSYKANTAASPVYYYYLRNLQGDITGIVNSSGSMVANYSYNAWGKLLDIQSYSNGDNIAAINPLRYRGYYYDTELALYYLQSRYYDPELGRFINADDVAYLGANKDFGSFNLFAYCGNNPIINIDSTGTWTISFSLNCNFAAAFGISIDYYSILIDSNGKIVFYTSSAYQVGTPNVSAGIGITYSTAKSADDYLSADIYTVGGSAGFIASFGVDLSMGLTNDNSDFYAIGFSFGASPIPAELHVKFGGNVWKGVYIPELQLPIKAHYRSQTLPQKVKRAKHGMVYYVYD